LHKEKRIFSKDWEAYSTDKAVYYPKHMSPQRLEELFAYAWETFYRDESQNIKMFKLLKQVVVKEKADGTFRPRRRDLISQTFGRKTR